MNRKIDATTLTGDELVKALGTLANPHRLRVIGSLREGRNYVSRLARELEISRALLQIHLKKLEESGFVRSELEISDDGKAMKFYEVIPFDLHLTSQSVTSLLDTLNPDTAAEK